MKISNFFLALVFLFFGSLVFGRPVLATEASPNRAYPDEKTTVLPTATLTPMPKPKVDYLLVYPGILPDHFLYPLKMIRDRAWLFLTTGSRRKAEVMLLFADKRLGAGRALIEGGKQGLGVTTLTKGEKYLEEAVAQLEQAKDKGEDIGELNKKFTKAVAKHEEILWELKDKVATDEWGVMDEMLAKTQALQVEIEKLP